MCVISLTALLSHSLIKIQTDSFLCVMQHHLNHPSPSQMMTYLSICSFIEYCASVIYLDIEIIAISKADTIFVLREFTLQ